MKDLMSKLTVFLIAVIMGSMLIAVQQSTSFGYATKYTAFRSDVGKGKFIGIL